MTLPIGPEVDARVAPRPIPVVLEGSSVRLEPLEAQWHTSPLWQAIQGHDDLWLYLGEGPFSDEAAFRKQMEKEELSKDPLYFAIMDQATDLCVGRCSLMRIEPTDRVIEVGNILYSPKLQRTRGATEAMYLLARHIFDDLGYRRYEWKCNFCNEPSKRAAVRLGFTYEGLFRQHKIMKGRNRDTAWFSMLDSEWPARKAEFERWLHPTNFDRSGTQRTPLAQGVQDSVKL